MGSIRSEVRTLHLSSYPQEEEFLKAFLPGFYVTWGRRRRAYNTELSVYFLNPEPFMREAFGFDQELMLVYSPYPRMEARAVQAGEAILSADPARGRVEKLTYLLVSEAPNTDEWFHTYSSMNPESRLIIPFSASELRKNSADAWFVRNQISRLLYGRDLFDFRLPLEKDTYFFGRSELIVNLFDVIKRSENRAIFGLRKTGKTSVLYKLERMLRADQVAEVFYFDCKLPSIRKLRWYELLDKVSKEIAQRFGLPSPGVGTEITAADVFIGLVSRVRKQVLLIFDEIEYISPLAIADVHWKTDFIDFWQTMWACQSRHRTICTMVAGVNPYVVEMDTVAGVQNPLFGIVSSQFLTGLGIDDTRNMIRTLGKRMGLQFDYDAITYIHDRYGGHPLLTRMACSVTNNLVKESKRSRPVILTRQALESEEAERDAELVFYCRHVVSELRQFYPDEYEMLELLSSGQVQDFVELASYPEYTKNLRAYGLLAKDKYNRPTVAVPVIQRYVGLELARREGRQTLLRVVPSGERGRWLEQRKESIIRDFRLLERAISKAELPSLFGPNSFPEADQFSKLRVVATQEDFRTFINTCNRCFVESVEVYGRSVGSKDYYWTTVKASYPGLWHALQRIKVYRHDGVHLALSKQVSEQVLEYLRQDLEGRDLGTFPDSYFVLQQCVLDGLLTGLQIELSSNI